ncbi:MAG: cytidine deaminase [Bdellovibrio sp. 28-41-41]|nr:MAG: cytidine deaminase [Bdellovibrio sp. 28-41-41]
MDDAEIGKAFEKAKGFRNNAYSPYSNFLVGAAVKLEGHTEIFLGCNIENATYGASICAEQVAITKAISQVPGGKLESLVLVTDTNPVAGPCGICLQIMNEFSSDNFMVHLANLSGIQKSIAFKNLLPLGFNRSNMSTTPEKEI